MGTTYISQDVKNEIYTGAALVADGYSSEILFDVDGGCPDGELIFKMGDLETGESVTLTLYHYISGAYAALPHSLVGLAADGVYVMPINNKVVTGSKLKVHHDVTLPSGSDGITMHGHFRPFN
jgi:hypothetical protein